MQIEQPLPLPLHSPLPMRIGCPMMTSMMLELIRPPMCSNARIAHASIAQAIMGAHLKPLFLFPSAFFGQRLARFSILCGPNDQTNKKDKKTKERKKIYNEINFIQS